MGLLGLVLLGLVIGLVLGGLGGGGAILTVPALVFLVGQSTHAAATSSLVIVGLSAAVGVVSHLKASPTCCRVGWRLALTLGVAGIPATWIGSRVSAHLDQYALLLGFSALMLLAAAMMWRDDQRPAAVPPHDLPLPVDRPRGGPDQQRAQDGAVAVLVQPDVDELPDIAWGRAVLGGLGVGLLTGFFGVGGGFVLVPVLVGYFKLPIKIATGTSLVVVAFNSAVALAARAGGGDFDWSVIVPFTLAAMSASVVARRYAVRIQARHLSRGFAVLLVLVAAYTAVESLLHLT